MQSSDQLRQSLKIEATNLSVSYNGVRALRIEEMNIQGNIIGVIGHNGAGKSTLLKTILGLLPMQSGSLKTYLTHNSGTVTLIPEKHLAFCPESGSVFGDISVEEYLKLWCRLKHGDANYYRKTGEKYLKLLHLTSLLPKLGRELSKGQKQRVQIAVGFLIKPKLFLFDEPFDGLDVQKTHELIELIEDHKDEMAFIISSHRMDVMERLCNLLVVVEKGEILGTGSVEETCLNLSGNTFRLTNVHNLEETLGALRKAFPAYLVNHIGKEISITGRTCDLDQISKWLQHFDCNGTLLEPANGSLVDSMNYHLKQSS